MYIKSVVLYIKSVVLQENLPPELPGNKCRNVPWLGLTEGTSNDVREVCAQLGAKR